MKKEGLITLLWDAFLNLVSRKTYEVRTAPFSTAQVASDKVNFRGSVGIRHLLCHSYLLDNLRQASEDSSSILRRHCHIIILVENDEMIRVLL